MRHNRWIVLVMIFYLCGSPGEFSRYHFRSLSNINLMKKMRDVNNKFAILLQVNYRTNMKKFYTDPVVKFFISALGLFIIFFVLKELQHIFISSLNMADISSRRWQTKSEIHLL